MKRYIPETIKIPIRKRRAEKKRNHVLNLKHPEILVIETTTRCNANCFYCGRPKENHDMDLDLFKAIINASPFVKEIHPNTRGEPLLYPHLIEAIEYCKEKGKRVQFYTNGSLVTRRVAEQLLNAGLCRIVFSIDDCEPIRYGLSRGGLDFFKVVRNVRRMVALRDAARFPTEIFVRATLTNINRDHQEEIREFWSFVDNFNFVPQIDVMPSEVVEAKPIIHSDRGLFCTDPFRTVAIRWNGQPVLCCNDWYDNFPIGHKMNLGVSENSMLEVFEETKRIGHLMLKGTLPAICAGCRNRRTG